MENPQNFKDELDRVLGEISHTERPDFDFDPKAGAREVMESLGVMNLEGFGIGLDHPALGVAGALLVYVEDVLKGKPGNLRRIEEFKEEEALILDPATQGVHAKSSASSAAEVLLRVVKQLTTGMASP